MDVMSIKDTGFETGAQPGSFGCKHDGVEGTSQVTGGDILTNDDIELEIPLGLIDAAIPRKVTKVRTWDELGSAATAESEQQSTRSRLSAITLLSMQEMPAEVQEALNSDSEV